MERDGPAPGLSGAGGGGCGRNVVAGAALHEPAGGGGAVSSGDAVVSGFEYQRHVRYAASGRPGLGGGTVARGTRMTIERAVGRQRPPDWRGCTHEIFRHELHSSDVCGDTDVATSRVARIELPARAGGDSRALPDVDL